MHFSIRSWYAYTHLTAEIYPSVCAHINKPQEVFLPSLQTVVAGVKKDFIFSSCTPAASRRWEGGEEELINFSHQTDSWCILWFKQKRSVVSIQPAWGDNSSTTRGTCQSSFPEETQMTCRLFFPEGTVEDEEHLEQAGRKNWLEARGRSQSMLICEASASQKSCNATCVSVQSAACISPDGVQLTQLQS